MKTMYAASAAALLIASVLPFVANAQQYCGYSGPSYVQPIYGSGAEPCGAPNDAAGYYYANYAPVYYVQHPYYTLNAGPAYNANYGGYQPNYYQYQQPSYNYAPPAMSYQPYQNYAAPQQGYYSSYNYASPTVYFY